MGKKRVDVTMYHGKPIESLQRLHTGTLLNIRDAAYKLALCRCCSIATNDHERQFNINQDALKKQVLEVLRTREHIPNKAEAKASHQAAAKKGR